MQLALDRARRLAHPEHHRGEHGHGQEPDQRLEQLLGPLRKLGCGQLEHSTDEQGYATASSTPTQTAGSQSRRPVCAR